MKVIDEEKVINLPTQCQNVTLIQIHRRGMAQKQSVVHATIHSMRSQGNFILLRLHLYIETHFNSFKLFIKQNIWPFRQINILVHNNW